ncbi:MBL fold metallo-hydrolase [Actinocrispum wychmicini]|uniref:Ribonuclease BN (tRNA processing enzyme) n=1 Tax=Actinocrispum wychmicini TaxID=1213861 RepID=A0A4R2JYL5_9PSEU|nr:MBL fold metallo-hydrolase [Actinocrispum wychmicini]TCO62538.1 ribonuclease BN (tRNA processing enzyme) [Actinocrispum wychmicini]
MLLTVLGCSGSVPGPNSPASGYLIEADNFLMVMDFGNGTLAELQCYCDPFLIGAMLFSHLHPDHCADFSALTVFRRYHPAAARRGGARLPVFGPSDAPARFAAAYAPDPVELAETDLSDTYDFRPLGPETFEVGPFEVTAVPVAHPCEAYGFRVSHGGKTLVYTGDTGPCDGLDKLAEGADVLLSEASWTHHADRPEGMHLSGRQAGELATRAGVGRLLITHVAPWTDREAVLAEARLAYTGEPLLVETGDVYTV